jgi:hypothetical protein
MILLFTVPHSWDDRCEPLPGLKLINLKKKTNNPSAFLKLSPPLRPLLSLPKVSVPLSSRGMLSYFLLSPNASKTKSSLPFFGSLLFLSVLGCTRDTLQFPEEKFGKSRRAFWNQS